MKINLFILGFLCSLVGLHSQTDFNKSIPTSSIQKVHFDFAYGDVTLMTYSGTEIQVTGSVAINNGLNDDAFRMEHSVSEGELSIKGFIKNIEDLPKTITIIKNGQKHTFIDNSSDKKELQKKIKEVLGTDKDIMSYSQGVDTDIELTIKVPNSLSLDVRSTYGDIIVQNITNPIKVKNTYGSVEATFLSLDNIKDVELVSTYDFVDITVPGNQPLSVDLDSDYGRIYTNLDLNIDTNRSKTKGFSFRIFGSLKNGGPLIKARARYDNIYLRKVI